MKQDHKQPPRWFKEQKERKKQTSNRWRRIILTVIILTVLFFVVGKIYLWHRRSLWDGQHNFNFVVWTGNQLYVLAYRAGTEEINILEVSPETYLPLAKGFGEYPASSVWQLGAMEKFGGGQLLQLSVQYFLGIPVAGWARVKTKESSAGEPKASGKMGKRELIYLLVKTAWSAERNLTSWDLWRLVLQVQKTPLAKINFYALDKTRGGEEITLPDGTRAFKIQAEFLNSLVRDLYKDAAVLEEGLIWLVVNKSAYPGLARDAARLIDNIGGEVAAVSERREPKTGGIYCWEEKICRSYTVKLLSRTFHLPVREEKIEENRAEAVIVLDEEYWRYFYQR